MKILDILSEAPQVDDGTSAINADIKRQLVRTARDKWLTALNDKGANPENEQAYIEKYIAMQDTYRPEADTMPEGPFRRAAIAAYGNEYHDDDPNWNHDEQKNTRKSGNVYDAPDSALDAANLGGAAGNLGDRAGRQNIDDKIASAAGADPIQKQAQVLARGQTPRTAINPKQTLRRDGAQQYRSSGSVTPEEQAERDARLVGDDEAQEARRQSSGGIDRAARSAEEAGMTTKQKRQNRFAQIRNNK